MIETTTATTPAELVTETEKTGAEDKTEETKQIENARNGEHAVTKIEAQRRPDEEIKEGMSHWQKGSKRSQTRVLRYQRKRRI